MDKKYRVKIHHMTNEEAQVISGREDKYIKNIEKAFHISILARGNEMRLEGAEVQVKKAEKTIREILSLYREKKDLLITDIDYLIRENKTSLKDNDEKLKEIIYRNFKKKAIRSRTEGQYLYVNTMKDNDIIFGIGPAGTGKTYLAVVMAVKALREKDKDKIILVRPAVEAGESLGFLPGDLKEKIDPYLRPLYDGLNDVLGEETSQKLIERKVIEIAPLAYMRGRTLDNAFIILDEAQNTTKEQMKMFLTRIGFNSKAVITGDLTQVDLPYGKKSGLHHCKKILDEIEGIAFFELTETDVVRHPLVKEIIKAYERDQ